MTVNGPRISVNTFLSTDGTDDTEFINENENCHSVSKLSIQNFYSWP